MELNTKAAPVRELSFAEALQVEEARLAKLRWMHLFMQVLALPADQRGRPTPEYREAQQASHNLPPGITDAGLTETLPEVARALAAGIEAAGLAALRGIGTLPPITHNQEQPNGRD